MMITNSVIIEFDISQRTYVEIPLTALSTFTLDKSKIYWVHCDLREDDIFKKISEKLFLPDETVRLCEPSNAISTFIDRDEFLILKLVCLLDEEERTGNLIIQLTTHFCFTASYEDLPVVEEFRHTFPQALRYAKTPCFIFFLMLDNIVNYYAKVLFSYDLAANELDSRVGGSDNKLYQEVMEAKNGMMRVRRNLVAVREILLHISGRKISVISEACQGSLKNLRNQTEILFQEVESIRDMLNDLMAQLDNILMQKLNETIRVLTAFAAIFLPLTLITGIYGMNFHWMPELSWRYGYFYVLGLIVFLGTLLLYIFKRRKWF